MEIHGNTCKYCYISGNWYMYVVIWNWNYVEILGNIEKYILYEVEFIKLSSGVLSFENCILKWFTRNNQKSKIWTTEMLIQFRAW